MTCITPTTASRRAWIPQLIEIFESQTYQDKELLFIAEGEWIEEFCVRPNIRFVIAIGNIGDKRNIGVRFAEGEAIVHLDDDDFSAPTRIADQIGRLEETKKAVTGYHTMLFTDGARWWRYHGVGAFAFGTSQCYLRQWAVDHPFESLNVGEDNAFGTLAAQKRQLSSVDAGELLIATIHPKNTSKKETIPGSCWLEVNPAPAIRAKIFPM